MSPNNYLHRLTDPLTGCYWSDLDWVWMALVPWMLCPITQLLSLIPKKFPVYRYQLYYRHLWHGATRQSWQIRAFRRHVFFFLYTFLCFLFKTINYFIATSFRFRGGGEGMWTLLYFEVLGNVSSQAISGVQPEKVNDFSLKKSTSLISILSSWFPEPKL